MKEPDAFELARRVRCGQASPASFTQSKRLLLQWKEFRRLPAAAFKGVEDIFGRNGWLRAIVLPLTADRRYVAVAGWYLQSRM